MDTTSISAAALILLLALGTGSLLARLDDAAPRRHRFETLDGMRGLLALGVFLCHSFAWHGFAHGQGWHDPANRLFLYLGQPVVLLFFMLTAFLFVGRLLEAKGREIDWLQLYVSRVLRLTPTYMLAMALLFTIVAIVTHLRIDGAGTGVVFRSWTDIFSAALAWIGFSMLGTPAIDAYMNTPLIMAGVTWSLPYEWTFYLLLPVLAIPLRIRLPLGAVLIGAAGLFWVLAWQPPAWRLAPFAGGMVAAVLVRLPRAARWASSRLAAVLAMGAFFGVVALAPTIFAPLPMAAFSFVFFVIAGGNDLFGLLRLPGARMLGKVSYSVYLLHGMVLYTFFMLVVGTNRAQAWSPIEHWLAIACLTLVVLCLAWLSQRWIEQPAIDAVPRLAQWIRSLVTTSRRAGAELASGRPAAGGQRDDRALD